LGISHERIGNVLMAQGHLDDVLVEYRTELAIMEPLADRDRSNTDWQRFISVVYGRIGIVFVKPGNRTEALKMLTTGRTIIARMTEISPDNVEWRDNLRWFEEQLQSLNR